MYLLWIDTRRINNYWYVQSVVYLESVLTTYMMLTKSLDTSYIRYSVNTVCKGLELWRGRHCSRITAVWPVSKCISRCICWRNAPSSALCCRIAQCLSVHESHQRDAVTRRTFLFFERMDYWSNIQLRSTISFYVGNCNDQTVPVLFVQTITVSCQRLLDKRLHVGTERQWNYFDTGALLFA